jgi:hypothetical protein
MCLTQSTIAISGKSSDSHESGARVGISQKGIDKLASLVDSLLKAEVANVQLFEDSAYARTGDLSAGSAGATGHLTRVSLGSVAIEIQDSKIFVDVKGISADLRLDYWIYPHPESHWPKTWRKMGKPTKPEKLATLPLMASTEAYKTFAQMTIQPTVDSEGHLSMSIIGKPNIQVEIGKLNLNLGGFANLLAGLVKDIFNGVLHKVTDNLMEKKLPDVIEQNR